MVNPGESLKVLRLALVSPGDVVKERDLADKVVEDLNRGIVKHHGYRLEIWRWETDARPGMHLQGPQGHIDEQMKLENAAIVVGMFWKRFGTPTLGAGSGTEHELRRAWALWEKNHTPEVIVYFCARSYNPKSLEELDQHKKVMEFREDMPKEQFWWPYKTPANFEQLFRRHLTDWFLAKFASPGKPADPPPPGPDPAPGSPPPVRFNLPRVTAHFSGRGSELADLQRALEAGGKAVITQTISGLGGVGKSQLAARFMHEHLEEYKVVAWIRSELSPVTDLAELGKELGLQPEGADPLPPEELAAKAKRFLEQTPRRWLVVFDNVADPKLFAEWAPATGSGKVLATSQRQDLDAFGPVLGIKVFGPETGANYLIETAGRPSEYHDALNLSKALGGLPLALSHAAAYCRQGGSTFAGYLELLEGLPAGELFDSNPEAFYEHTVASTWRASIDKACEQAPLAAQVLEMAAHLAPDKIDRSLFEVLIDGPTPGERKLLTDAINALARFSLVVVDYDSISVHRLLQKVVRDSAPDNAGALNALRSVAAAFPASEQELALPAVWGRCQQLSPHVFALQRSEERLTGEGQALVNLCNHACDYFYYAGDSKRAFEIGLHATEIGERILGPDHPDTIRARNNLAGSYQSAGRTTEAIPIQEQVVADRERILGPNHPDTIGARNNLASSYWSAGRTAEAIPIEEQVVADRERILGPDHPDTITARANLAGYYQSAGRTAEAIPIQQKVVADSERILGPDHPDTILARHNLAISYHSAGRTTEAIPIQEQVVADWKRILGPDHPNTILARNNLASSYQLAGRTTEAIPIQKKVVADRERILGPAHPGTIMARNNLAYSYQSAGRTTEAIPIQEQVVADCERILGPDHPKTITARDNLEWMRRSS